MWLLWRKVTRSGELVEERAVLDIGGCVAYGGLKKLGRPMSEFEVCEYCVSRHGAAFKYRLGV